MKIRISCIISLSLSGLFGKDNFSITEFFLTFRNSALFLLKIGMEMAAGISWSLLIHFGIYIFNHMMVGKRKTLILFFRHPKPPLCMILAMWMMSPIMNWFIFPRRAYLRSRLDHRFGTNSFIQNKNVI